MAHAPADRNGKRPDGAVLLVHVIPRAGRTAIAGRRGDAVLVRIAAPPVEDAANAALIEVLADALKVPRRAIALLSGGRSRHKRLRVDGLTAADLTARIAAVLGE